MVRSIGASFGVTVTSVFFERRRALHQFMGYATYDSAASTHEMALRDLRLSLHEAGVPSADVHQTALGTLRQQLDIDAIATSFQESFLLICVCFLIAMGPMLYLLRLSLRVRTPGP